MLLMRIQDFLQIILAICLLLLPAVLMAALLRVPRCIDSAQRDRSLRAGIVLGTGYCVLWITYGTLAWLAAAVIYSIAEFYFDSVFGFKCRESRARAWINSNGASSSNCGFEGSSLLEAAKDA